MPVPCTQNKKSEAERTEKSKTWVIGRETTDCNKYWGCSCSSESRGLEKHKGYLPGVLMLSLVKGACSSGQRAEHEERRGVMP